MGSGSSQLSGFALGSMCPETSGVSSNLWLRHVFEASLGKSTIYAEDRHVGNPEVYRPFQLRFLVNTVLFLKADIVYACSDGLKNIGALINA